MLHAGMDATVGNAFIQQIVSGNGAEGLPVAGAEALDRLRGQGDFPDRLARDVLDLSGRQLGQGIVAQFRDTEGINFFAYLPYDWSLNLETVAPADEAQ